MPGSGDPRGAGSERDPGSPCRLGSNGPWIWVSIQVPSSPDTGRPHGRHHRTQPGAKSTWCPRGCDPRDEPWKGPGGGCLERSGLGQAESMGGGGLRGGVWGFPRSSVPSRHLQGFSELRTLSSVEKCMRKTSQRPPCTPPLPLSHLSHRPLQFCLCVVRTLWGQVCLPHPRPASCCLGCMSWCRSPVGGRRWAAVALPAVLFDRCEPPAPAPGSPSLLGRPGTSQDSML